jgi:hypothetical protein
MPLILEKMSKARKLPLLCVAKVFTQKIKPGCYSEVFINYYQTTWHHISQDSDCEITQTSFSKRSDTSDQQ